MGQSTADEDEEPDTRVYIAGPPSHAFPIADGWAPENPQPDPHYAITKLTHLTLKRLTKHYTHHAIDMKRPNCEANWQSRIQGPPIPWEKIWPTLGTPLSDATEERNWRKLLHRALFVRNRDPKARSHDCRLKCSCTDESMLHLIQGGSQRGDDAHAGDDHSRHFHRGCPGSADRLPDDRGAVLRKHP